MGLASARVAHAPQSSGARTRTPSAAGAASTPSVSTRRPPSARMAGGERAAVAHASGRSRRRGISRCRRDRAATTLAAATEEEALTSKVSTSSKEVALLVGAAALFGAGIGVVQGPDKASEFFAGYLLEQSLSVDNLFVFVLVFQYFQVPEKYHSRVLSYGIWGAVVMRAAMILAGAAALERFEPLLLGFAGILLFSSYKLLFTEEDDEEDLSDNAIVKLCKRLISVSENYDKDNFFTEVDGVKMATPLLLVLAVVELSDVVFAVDSIPAVFGVTKDTFIVYSSNIFAILCLRSLYGFVSTAVTELRYLQPAVALVLGFVGGKMVFDYFGYELPTEASLAVVASLLGGGVGASILLPAEPESDDA